MVSNLMSLVERMQGQKILLLGDMVADVYLEGKVSRISREAPVLILEHAGETVVPGGAANAVYNAAALGGSVHAVGIVGNDSVGERLRSIFHDSGIIINGIVVDTERSTISKTRIMAGGQATVRQQIVRIDKETKSAISEAIEAQLLTYLQRHISEMRAVVLSDYGSGTITPAIKKLVIGMCNDLNIPCMVDSRYDILSYANVTLVKQNEVEAAQAIGLSELNDNTLLTAGTTILEGLKAKAVLITQGPDGMTLFEKGQAPVHIPVTNKSEVYDVTGAGDTVVVAMMLAIAAGASCREAACLANFAAGVVVKKPGTATTTPCELCEAIGGYSENT